MWSVLRRSLIRGRETTLAIMKKTKRSAGHSKWANIKHLKAVTDAQRATQFAKLVRQMNVAINEEGSFKPEDNLRLSQVIEIAKKKNMPMATINGVLEKAAKSTAKLQVYRLDVRGPGGSIIVIELFTDNFKQVKTLVQYILKKNGSMFIDQSARHVFHHKGIVVTEMKNSLDDAMEDAIAVGAEDVEEFEDDSGKFLRFSCDPVVLPKMANLLASRNYTIVLHEEQFTPHIFANLSDTDIERTEKLFAKLEALDEVSKVYDNIA